MTSELEQIIQALEASKPYKNKDGSYNRLRKSSDTEFTDKESIPLQRTLFKTAQEEASDGGKHPENINELLEIVFKDGASDLHIVVGAPPRYRINGELRNIFGYAKLMPEDTKKILSGLLNDETASLFDSEGDLDFAYSLKNVGRFRVNLYKQRNTWAGVFRALSNKIYTVKDLYLPESIVELTTRKRGLVLVTGPTGSGKSTTLAALIDLINEKYRKNIITLEDPIEYLHRHKLSNVTQREMGVDSKDFAMALRASLREDPDVILVGEMRDYETISTAVTAAETGHLVFSTLHTIGAANTIDRIIDTYPASQQGQARNQLSHVIQGVISQQLIPKADGSGRVAAFEIMLANDAIRSQVRDGKTEQIAGTIQISKAQGMRLLDDNLFDLVRQGLISSESAVEFAVNKPSMAKRLGGGE